MSNLKQQHLELKSLRLQNFATFSNQEVNFEKGMNAIIGETGSGKSLLMEALALVLGERADKKVIRSGHEFATIEAYFKTQGSSTKKYLDEQGFPVDGDEIVIKRVIYQEGKSKNFLNLQQCSLQTLQDFTREYIDLVGQFENQKLLSSVYQLELLDEFADDFAQKKTYQDYFQKYSSLVKRRSELQTQEKNRLQQIDFLKFQVDEIEQLNVSVEDEKKLLDKKENILNREQREKAFAQLKIYFEGSDEQKGLNDLIELVQKFVLKNKTIISNALEEKVIQLNNLLSDVEQEVSGLSTGDLNDEDISEVMDRLDRYQKLKRKYGGTIEAVLDQYQTYKKELLSLENLEIEHGKMDKEIAALENKLKTLAQSMRKTRLKAALELSKNLTTKIRELNMKGAVVEIKLNELLEFTATGIDELCFMVQTNPGEGIHRLDKVASGGELSRILLCLRQLSSATGKISIFLFDEVDTGIGGETAMLLGKHLHDLSKKIQVLAITHLPQIAFNADVLIKVEKEISKIKNESRTISKVTHFKTKKEVMAEAKSMVNLTH